MLYYLVNRLIPTVVALKQEPEAGLTFAGIESHSDRSGFETAPPRGELRRIQAGLIPTVVALKHGGWQSAGIVTNGLIPTVVALKQGKS